MKLYTLYDRVAGTYSVPFCMVNDEIAKRAFRLQFSSCEYAKDIALYSVGTFDESTAEIVPELVFIEYGQYVEKVDK